MTVGRAATGAGQGDPPASRPSSPRTGPALALGAAAAAVLGLSLFLSDGALDPLALGGVTFATAAALAAMILLGAGRSEQGRPAGRRWTLAILWTGLGASLVLDAAYLPGVYVDPAGLGWFRPVLGGVAIVTVAHAWPAPPWLARARHALLLAGAAALGGIVLLASPRPAIDVWYFEGIGANALLHGVNPYAVLYPNIYGPGAPFLAPSLLSPDQRWVLSNPYTPLPLLLVAPATALLSDPRWTMIAALLFSAWAIHRLGRGSAVAGLASAFLLVQPRTLFVLEQAWTEPLTLAAILGIALAISRLADRAPAASAPPGHRGWLAVALAGAVALSMKQYAPLLLLPLLPLVPRGLRLRTALTAAAVAVAVALPFLLWDPAAFIRGVVLFQVQQPFRSDALAWPAALAAYAGVRVPTWPAFPIAAAVLAWACRPPFTLPRALLASALAWLAFVVLNKQAFCNYYWLAVGLLCAAVAAGSREIPTHERAS